jgi:hypothetical protein
LFTLDRNEKLKPEFHQHGGVFALIFAKDYKVTLDMIEANMMLKIINVEIQLNIGTNDQNVIS